jgi:hypothetical protein
MLMGIIQKIQNCSEMVDLSLLTIDELDRLHFDEEVSATEMIKAAPPFSEERQILMKKGYENIVKIMDEKSLKRGILLRSFGASEKECRLVKKMIRKIRQQTKKNSIVFYEMGVGRGLIVNSLLDENNLLIKGCDIVLEQGLKNNPKFYFDEGTIFDALSKIDDASIDLFYSDNVLEHILEDEIDEHINLIYRKMADNGVVITITPNCFMGPHDITRSFFPLGTKPKGFHFHEYSYFEMKKLFVSHGFKRHSYILTNLLTHRYLIACKCIGRLIEVLRFIAESLSPWIYPLILRKAILYTLGCQTIVCVK